ncbi:hypothetical protein, partial [Cryobacterium sp. TMT1-66-1]|uniref:hypothetical protein n=1 Tax=Cryobacterium sp. TMT1-66-1 TaxID=1259242 RepID=UPI0018E075B5
MAEQDGLVAAGADEFVDLVGGEGAVDAVDPAGAAAVEEVVDVDVHEHGGGGSAHGGGVGVPGCGFEHGAEDAGLFFVAGAGVVGVLRARTVRVGAELVGTVRVGAERVGWVGAERVAGLHFRTRLARLANFGGLARRSGVPRLAGRFLCRFVVVCVGEVGLSERDPGTWRGVGDSGRAGRRAGRRGFGGAGNRVGRGGGQVRITQLTGTDVADDGAVEGGEPAVEAVTAIAESAEGEPAAPLGRGLAGRSAV